MGANCVQLLLSICSLLPLSWRRQITGEDWAEPLDTLASDDDPMPDTILKAVNKPYQNFPVGLANLLNVLLLGICTILMWKKCNLARLFGSGFGPLQQLSFRVETTPFFSNVTYIM